MKNIFFLSAVSLAMLSLGSCSDEIDYGMEEGDGRVLLRPVIKSDVEVKGRAAGTDDALASEAVIWISNSKGPVRKFTGVQNVPAEGLWLKCDNYVAEVWAGDSVPASFTQKQFKGRQTFSVAPNKTQQVTVDCRIANSVVEVRYTAGVDEVLEDYYMEVGHKADTLRWTGAADAGKAGYFMIPSFDRNLRCKFTGTKIADKSTYTKEIVIADPKPATKYVVTVQHNEAGEEEFGGGLFDIVVDEKAVEVVDEIIIDSAPVIQALNFDFSQPVTGSKGTFSDKKVWIRSIVAFKSITVSCPTLSGVLGIGGSDFDVVSMDPAIQEALKAKGFDFMHYTHTGEAENPEFEEMKLLFRDVFMNLIPNGEHPVTITAVDSNNRKSVAVMNVSVTDAMLRTEAIDDLSAVWATKATVTASIIRDGGKAFGFNYRKHGTQQWTFVPVAVPNPAAGQRFSHELTGLEPGAAYEYQGVADDMAANTLTFTTESAGQLPNAGFEEWNTSKTPYLIGDRSFWDSGNHGSATMSKNVTMPDESVKHGGARSLKMHSQFVGVGIIGKFAAGNVFTGRYLATDGTDGQLGWGRKFASRPKALRGYVKYQSVEVNCNGASSNKPTGQQDQGIIRVAVLDDSTVDYTDKNGTRYTEYPVVVETKPQHFFDENGANVIAYGEKLFDTTDGTEMIQFEIPLNYKKTNVKAGHIMVVASSSKQGDYFIGGNGSMMWIDDLELVY